MLPGFVPAHSQTSCSFALLMKLIFKKDSILRLVRIVVGLVILTGLSLLGNRLSPLIPFPMPGPVIGLILVFVLLTLGWLPLKWVDEAGKILLLYLGLFYVPYGVGIIDVDPSVRRIGWKIIPIAITVVVVVMLVTAKLFTFLGKKNNKN